MPVEFLVLNDVELIVSRVESNMYVAQTQEDEVGDMEGPNMGNMFFWCSLSPPISPQHPKEVNFEPHFSKLIRWKDVKMLYFAYCDTFHC